MPSTFPGLSILLVLGSSVLCGCAMAPESPDMPHQHHTIDYIEFTVTDMAQAQSFYADAFGWSFTDYGPDYAGIQKPGGGESGGLSVGTEVRTGGPLVVLYSADLEASEQSVRDAGGVITVEPFDFPGGRRFQFRDPFGNELAVWSEP